MASIIMGIFFILVGGYGVYWSNKRSFDRRNQAGVEEFSSYAASVGSRALEGVIKIAGIFAVLLGGVAILMGWVFGK
jgi:hypothetical protein